MKYNNLLDKSKRYKNLADKILQESKIVKVLEKFGKVEFTGSYAADLMVSGDIDIYVINRSFSKNKVFEIFNKIVKSYKFRGYLFFDFKSHRRPGFPFGYYVGLKIKKYNDEWKIDIWFITNKELQKIKYLNLKEITIDKKKKLAILKFKSYRNKLKSYRNKVFPKTPSNVIYDAVLKHNILKLSEFKKYLTEQKEK